MSNEQSMPTQASHGGMVRGGHLYMQTNENRNAIIHYRRSASGTITEAERILTSGSGSGVFKPISGQESAPNAFEGAGSVILTSDRRFLFTTNGGDNSVSSFAVSDDGKLTLLDVKRTGNVVTGRSGTAKSLAYAASSGTLFVLHAFGRDHVRLMSVDGGGKLTARPERYSVNTQDKSNRVSTIAVLSPDGKFLLVGTTFDQPSAANPDGSPILWVRGADDALSSIASNAPDPDGLVVFPVDPHGTLGAPTFHDAGGGSPFYPAFLHGRPDHFVVGEAVGDGLVIGSIDANGRIGFGPLVQIDTSAGKPSELCWLSVSPDDRLVFATNFGYSKNQIDLAPYVRANLEVMDRNARAVRGERPFVLTNCFAGDGLGEVTGRIEQVIGRQLTAPISSST